MNTKNGVMNCYWRIDGLHVLFGIVEKNPKHVTRERFRYKGGGLENTGGREHLFGNVYFSTMRAATDKRSSPVERVDQVGNG